MRTSTFLLKGLVAGGSFALANPNPDPVANPEPQITVTPAASQVRLTPARSPSPVLPPSASLCSAC